MGKPQTSPLSQMMIQGTSERDRHAKSGWHITIRVRPKSHRQTISLHTLVMSQESSRMKCSLAQAYISIYIYFFLYRKLSNEYNIRKKNTYDGIQTCFMDFSHPNPAMHWHPPYLAHHFKTCDFGTSRSETWQQILHIKLEIACSLLQIVWWVKNPGIMAEENNIACKVHIIGELDM